MKKFKYIILIIVVIYLYYNLDRHYIESVSFNDDIIYLTKDEEYKLDYNIDYYDDYIVDYKFISNNDHVVKVNGDKIIGKDIGNTTIDFVYENKKYASLKVVVTDLYGISKIDNNKESLKCSQYSENDNELLDKILKFKISKKGYESRAGVVEAARFLTLNFKNKISYFYENGRLKNYEKREYVDAEGRYYHKGLYLNNSKYNELISSLKGPVIWGCDLYSRITKTFSPNGLDCSGFVTWAILNGGFNIGDVGAGDYEEYIDELTDIGEKINIENIEFDSVKPGDLIGYDGHIAMIIGIENNTYYIAEALDPDLHVLKIQEDELDDDFDYIINMDLVYKNDGDLSEMW